MGSSLLRLRPEDLAWRALDGEAVVVDLTTMTVYCLNETAAALWQRLEHGSTTEDLAATLVERYDVELPNAISDLADWLGELAGMGWIEHFTSAAVTDAAVPGKRSYAGPRLQKRKDSVPSGAEENKR